jgi:hypothetical protein
MSQARRNPFDLPAPWLKGGIHIHTTRSDGVLDPEEALEVYRRRGYDFVAFGDHGRVTLPQDPKGQVLVLPGAEWDAVWPGRPGHVHLMAVGTRDGHEQAVSSLRQDPCALAEALAAACEFLVLAHPYWSSLTTELIAQLPAVDALEVYNHGCEVDQGLGYSMYVWDQLLSRGRRCDAVAVDDSHFRGPDYCGGWVMVKAAGRSAAEVLSALKAGQFYSTCGPEICAVEFPAPRGVRVRTSPVRTVMFRCDRWPGINYAAAPGHHLTCAEWELPAKALFVRIEVTDQQGRKAWTNPFYL